MDVVADALATLGTTTYNSSSGVAGYSVGWFTLALINAGIAQGKNRSGMNWFVISVFFGPLATLFLVAGYPKE